MDFSLVCRTCLCDGSLNPLFKDNDNHDTFSHALYMATGIQIKYNDDLPQNMCNNCMIKLNNTLKFRKQCRKTETKLFEIISRESNTLKKHRKKSFQNTANKINSGLKSNATNVDKRGVMIKIEVNDNDSLNEFDFDDNMPLKLLIDSETPEVKLVSPKHELDEETPYDYENIQATSDNKIKEEKFNIAADTDSIKLDILLTENIQKSSINTEQVDINSSDTLNSSISSKLTKINDVTDTPYEILIDSVTQKATRVLCKLCNKELSIRSIDFHMTRRHPGADERKVKCDLCDTFVMKNKLNRHMLLMHGSENFRCGYCKSEFVNKEELVEHVRTCTAKKRNRKINESGRELRECDECHKVMQKASLRMHKAVKHAGLKPVCEHCGKSFGNKFRLNEHYRAKHGYEKFKCSYCEFRSAGTMAMKNHERRHRDEKPFVCEECGAKFHAAYLLVQHKHSHRTEKLVKCDLCPSTFKANNSLHMHKLTCHSNLSYKCGICCRSYKCRHYAVKHIRHVHRYTGPSPPLTVVTNDDVMEKISRQSK